jgi:hypothetical protein
VTVTDHAGSSMSATATYTLTQVAPTVSMPAPSTSRTVTATVDPGADVASIVCSVAGPNGLTITPSTCGTSSDFAIPAGGWDGDYVLTVTVTDHAGSSMSATATYTLTQVAPTASFVPASGTDRTVPVTVNPGADVNTITCTVAGPNGLTFAAASCGSSMALGIPSSGWDGDYVLTVTVTDHNGSSMSATATYSLQLAPPVIAPLGSGTSRTVSVSVGPGPDVASMSCVVNGPNGLTFTPATCSPTMTFTIPSSGWDGSYVLTVTVTDHLGAQASSSATYTLQLAPPVISPLGSGTSRTVAVTIDPGADVTSMVCSVTGPNVTFVPATCSPSMTFTIPSDGWDGVYTLTVTVTDHLGATASASRRYTLTLAAPVITMPAPSTDRSVPVTVDGGPDVSSMTCSVTGPNVTYTPPTCGPSMTLSIPSSGWDGIYTLTVTVTDHLGATATSTADYTLLQSAPVLSMPTAGTDRTVPLTVEAGADVASMSCSVTDPNGVLFAPASCGPTMSLGIPTTSPDGTYVLTVTVTDHLGSTSTSSATYALQLAPAAIAPLGSGTSRTVAVSFDPGPDVTALACSVSGPNGLTFTPSTCAPSMTFTIPAAGWDGDYVLTVTVTDHLGATASATATYTLTQVAPTASIVPASGTGRAVTATVDPGADVASIVCSVAGPNGLTVTPSTCGTSTTFTIPAGGWDGDYVVTVTVTDHAGSSMSASATYTLTQVAPTASIVPASGTGRSVSATVDPGADVASIVCSVAGPNGLTVAPSTCGTSSTFTIPAGGWDGDYVLTVTVTDHNGSSMSATATYTLTQVAPTASIVPASGTGRSVTATVDPGADVNTIVCSVAGPDGLTATPSTCGTSSTFTIPAGGWDGDYVLTVTVTDHAGSSMSVSATYMLTQVAPTASITPASGTGRTVTATVAPGADVNAIVCSVAGPNGLVITPSTCGTSTTFTVPAGGWDGDYVLTVTVTDHAGSSMSASAAYTLTQIAPTVSMPAPSTSRTVTATVDLGADVNTVTCSVAGPNGLSVTPSTCGTSTGFTIPAVGWDGDYVLTVTVTDHAGSSMSASATYTLTQVAPTVSVPAPSTSRTVTATVAPGADVNTITCSVSGPNGLVITPSTCGTSMTFTIPAGGWDGDYVLTVTVTDHAGGSMSASATYTLTQIAPTASMPAPSTSRTVTATVDLGADVNTVTCSVTGPNGLSVTPSACGASTTFTIPAGGWDGDYVLTVTVTDHAGNSASVSAAYVLQLAAPVIAPLGTGSSRTVAVSFDPGPDVTALACTVSGRRGLTFVPSTCASSMTFTIPANGWDGDYVLTVTLTDHLGATATSTATYTLTPTAPVVTAFPVSPASTRQPQWSVTSDVADLSGYQCTSAVPVLRCGSVVQLDLTGLVDGTYTVTVQAVDSLGVAGETATLSFTLIPLAPYVVVAPTSPASSRTPQWTFGDGAVDVTGYVCSAVGPGGVVAPVQCGVGSSVGSLDLTGLVDGTYALTVQAVDSLGAAGDPVTFLYTRTPSAPYVVTPASSPASTLRPQWSIAVDVVDLSGYRCTSSVTVLQCGSLVQLDLTGLVDGTYTVTVWAVDSLGVAGEATTLSFTLIPPAPYVTVAPVSPASVRTPQWSISDSVVDLAGYDCASSVPVLRCGSVVQLDLTGLVDGSYTVTVRAIDRRGALGDPLTLTYRLVPPAPSVTSSPATPSASRTPSWTLTDGAVGAVTYDCSTVGPNGITAPVSCGATPSVSLDLTGLPDGLYTVTVRARDSLGALGDATSFTYLLVPPSPTVVAAPASPLNSRQPVWTLTDDVAGVTYECTANGPTAVTVTCAGSTATLDLAAAVDGVYSIAIVAVDSLGHSSDPAAPLRVSYVLDTTPPAAPLVSVTPSPSQGRTVRYVIGGVEPGGTVICSFTAPLGATVSVPSACGTGVTLDLTGQPDGSYVLRVTVRDIAGNTSAATVSTYVLDTTAPVAPVATIASPGNDVTPTPTLVVEPGATLTCVIQRYFLTVATLPCGTDGTVDLSAFGDGEFQISLWATDAAGNVGPVSAPYTYLLDTVAPAAPVLTSPASPSPVTDPVWRWTTQPDTTTTCTVTAGDGAVVQGPVACTDLFTGDFRSLPDGSYTFAVVAGDAAGNRSRPATSVWILDRTAPVPPTVVPPTSPDNTTSPRWLITAPRGATLTCTLSHGRTLVLAPGVCPANGVVSLAGMPDGTYTMRVTATDSAGNVSAASITTYVLDTVAPGSPTLAYGSPSSGTSRTPFWGFVLPSGTTGRCELVQSGTVIASRECTAAVSFTLDGPDGAYAVRIIALDAAGNASAPLVVSYYLYGHGGGVAAGGGGSTGHRPAGHGPKPAPPGTVQRIIDRLGTAAGQASKTVRRAAGGVVSAVPSLPVIHDPLTNNVSHAVQHVINAVSKAGGGTGFPLLLLVIVAIFLMAQSRVDRRDPKLALASVAADDHLQFGPPPSRGDAS